MKKLTLRRIFLLAIFIIILLLNIYTIIFIIQRYEDEKHNQELLETIDQVIDRDDTPYNDNLEFMTIDFNELLSMNSDTVAYLKVDGTNINYPVVQTNNNDYYLTHSFDHSENDSGWIFLDYRNNINQLSKNTIIYGHNRLTGSMFGSLKNLLSSDYQNKKEHLIYLSTPSINYIFEVFSTYTISKETYYLQTSFENDKKYNSFLNILKSRSNYNYNVDLGSSDCILTLSTCSGLNNRTVVHAKLIKKSS